MQSHRCVVAGRPARAAAAAAPCSLRAAAGVSRPSPSLWRNFETFFVSQPPASRSPLSAQQRCSHLARASLAPPLVEHAAPPKKRLAVFVSGGGSNFRAIHAACQDGRINGEVVVVVSDVPACGGMQYAAANGIPTLTYPIPKKGNFPGLTKEALVASLTQQHKVDCVILAGYLKLVPEQLVAAYHRAMLNIHPGLLPAFGGAGMYGERVHKAVVASGVRFSGPTVHFVDVEYDTGPILAQRVVPVSPTDTPAVVAAKVLKEEHSVYPEAVAALCDGRITWRADGVPIMWSAK